MTSLGSVLSPEDDSPRGPDLRVEVDVPRAALGIPEGVVLEVAPELVADDGTMHRRVVSPHDEADELRLHLPDGFPDGGVLRLRGQGAAGEHRPGDLYVRVHLVGGSLPATASATSLAARVPAAAVGAVVLGVVLLGAWLLTS